MIREALQKYDPEIREGLEALYNKNSSDKRVIRSEIEHVKKLAAANGSEELQGITSCIFAMACIDMSDTDQALRYLKEAARVFQSLQMYDWLFNIYNMYGAVMTAEQNYDAALEYMLTAVEINDKCDQGGRIAVIYANMAQLFRETGAYKEALELLLESNSRLRDNKDYKFRSFNILNTYAGIASCCMNMHMDDELAVCVEDMLTYADAVKKEGGLGAEFVINVFLACKYHASGETEDLQKTLSEIDSMLAAGNVPYMENYLEYHDYVLLLKQLGDTERQAALAKMAEAFIASGTCSESSSIRLYRFLIPYYQECGVEEKVTEYSKAYFRMSERVDRHTADALKYIREAHDELRRLRESEDRIRLDNQRLELTAHMDMITGLPNRRYLNEYADEAFARAAAEGRKIRTDILDIDSFAKINDRYGHITADSYLKSVAGCIKHDEKSIFAARYDGDVFVIVFYDVSDEEVEEYASELAKKVREMHLPNDMAKRPYVTISQGIYSCHPEKEGMRLWNCLSMADKLLTVAKQSGGDAYRIIH